MSVTILSWTPGRIADAIAGANGDPNKKKQTDGYLQFWFMCVYNILFMDKCPIQPHFKKNLNHPFKLQLMKLNTSSLQQLKRQTPSYSSYAFSLKHLQEVLRFIGSTRVWSEQVNENNTVIEIET